jgi:putative hydrolase of the HAD superfamily
VGEVYRAAGQRHGAVLDEGLVDARFRAACRRFACEEGEPCTAAGERERWRRIVSDVFAPALLPANELDELFQSLWNHFAQPASWAVYDDAPETCTKLAALGYRLGVASNYDDRLKTICRGHAALADCRELFPVTRVGWAKPDRAYYESVARLLGQPPESILLVGDDLAHDVEAARRAGWQALLLDRTGQGRASQRRSIASLHELPGLLAAAAS